jgi:hypothetical protein
VVDDDRAVRERMAALEAEVRADADADRARREAAAAKVREARARQVAERDELSARQVAIVKKQPAKVRKPADDSGDDSDDLGGAIELAGKANKVRKELAKPIAKGEKSWIKSGIASLALGPIGWLYAGSLRETIPLAAGWVVLAAIASKIIPVFLLMPALYVALPLSGIAGVVYAVQYNRHGSRQRLFGTKQDKPKQLRGG